MQYSLAEVELLADKVAKATVKETFRLFGVDLDDQKSINDFTDNLKFAGRMRKLSDRGKMAAMVAAISVIVPATIAYLWNHKP